MVFKFLSHNSLPNLFNLPCIKHTHRAQHCREVSPPSLLLLLWGDTRVSILILHCGSAYWHQPSSTSLNISNAFPYHFTVVSFPHCLCCLNLELLVFRFLHSFPGRPPCHHKFSLVSRLSSAQPQSVHLAPLFK